MEVLLGPVPLAMAAACLFAASHVAARRGLVESSAVAAVVAGGSTAMLVLGLFVVLDPPRTTDGTGLALFALGGLAAPGVSRWSSAVGIQRLGPSVAVPITQGTRPLLTVVGAGLLLGEIITAVRLTGVLLIIVGGWKLTKERGEARLPGMGALEGPLQAGVARPHFFRMAIAFPIMTSFAYAVQDLLAKRALAYLPSPQFGALVGIATALALWILALLIFPRLRAQLIIGRDVGWLCLSGVLGAIALLSLFTALQRGDVSQVSPIAASQTLVVFLLSRVLLKDLEQLRASTALSGLSIVAGTVLVSI